MLRIANLRVALQDDTALEVLAARRLRVTTAELQAMTIIRRAVDARRKNNINFVYTLEVELTGGEDKVIDCLAGDRDITVASAPVFTPVQPGCQPLLDRPVVVGAGPAGLLAALTLAEYGYRPLVLERGKDVDSRSKDVASFWREGILAENSNVQFGEGGAGAFSDGKLTTRVTDPRMNQILNLFVKAGAPAEIKYLHKPHVGTDRLRKMVKNLRQQIIALGGQVEFCTQVTDLEISEGCLQSITVSKNGQSSKIPCQALLLAVGHSARDTYAMLKRKGVSMAAKSFAIGLRIEHPQELIDRAQYGQSAGNSRLGAAEYALVYQDKAAGRTAYSFCMCPGGSVVAAASEAGGVVTNGMSLYNRNSGIANSAMVVGVNPADCGEDVLAGVEFQRRYEQLAYEAGGCDYSAPVQTVGDFLHDKNAGKPGLGSALLQPSYLPGTKTVNLQKILPDFVALTLHRALPDFGRKIKGFDHPGAVLTGVETRTSAPVRLLRGADFCAQGVSGLYPAGEGAGYAGGIMSAALDGMNAALAMIQYYKPF